MKIERKTGIVVGHHTNIKTSGGGNFSGWVKKYDPESNTLELSEGFMSNRIHIDADKIVSVQPKGYFMVILLIAVWVIGMFLLLDITGSKNKGNYYRDDYRYDRYRY